METSGKEGEAVNPPRKRRGGRRRKKTPPRLFPYSPLSSPNFRVGIGVDMHPLVTGRPLWLGGVNISFDMGMDGHSDGDCLTHAIVDAVLGAAGLGDIGTHFGANRPKYQHAKSDVFLRGAMAKIRKAGWSVQNVDATVMCEAPRLGPHIPTMRRHLARLLGVAPTAMNVKATTAKGLGDLGASEAIVSFVVVGLKLERP